MAKPLTFYQTLNQAPRSAKHGKHRRASPPSHRSPIVGTDHGSGADASFVTWVPPIPTVSIDWRAVFAKFPQPKPPAIPNAGIRAGEIIGHRMWWVFDEDGDLCLSSLAHMRLWKPGEVVQGGTNQAVHHDPLWEHTIWGGTYAFSSVEPAAVEAKETAIYLLSYQAFHPSLGPWWAQARCLAVGTIKMWGDVVEHERGYRAEFAKLHSIDELYGGGDIDALRERYGVSPLSGG